MKKELRSGIRYVLVVQCAKSRARCSGFACEEWFATRRGSFEGYAPGTRFLAITCGGCALGTLAEQLAHFKRKLARWTDITPEEVSVHLSSCMVTDNSHHVRCGRVDKIRALVASAGFTHVTEGTYVSARAQAKREAGVYRNHPTLEME